MLTVKHRISINVPEDEYGRLADLSKRTGVPISAVVRQMVRGGLGMPMMAMPTSVVAVDTPPEREE